jgi:hypothetical protein
MRYESDDSCTHDVWSVSWLNDEYQELRDGDIVSRLCCCLECGLIERKRVTWKEQSGLSSYMDIGLVYTTHEVNPARAAVSKWMDRCFSFYGMEAPEEE